MAASWFDLDDAPPREVARAEILPRAPEAVEGVPHQKWLLSKQRNIFLKSTELLEDALAARDLDPAVDAPPESWIDALGEKEAWKRFRVARSAWLNAKEAPVMLKLAKELVVGISKALAQDQSGPKILNLQIVNMPATAERKLFPEMEVDDGEVAR